VIARRFHRSFMTHSPGPERFASNETIAGRSLRSS
jgi:hypothetical protein